MVSTSTRLVLGCHLFTSAFLSLLLIRLGKDVKVQPGPTGCSHSQRRNAAMGLSENLSELNELLSEKGLKIIHQISEVFWLTRTVYVE